MEKVMGALLKQEKFLLLAIIAMFVAYPLEHVLLGNGQVVALVSGLALVGFIVCASMRVAHHAEMLAEKVGDPYGTMILTLSAVLVEVVILAIMMSNEPSPTLVRDTIYSAVMLDINGILGLAALMGGIKHGEQSYNDDSARTYSVMILTAMGVSMVVPEFIPKGDWKIYSAFTIGAMILLYTLFLRMQVGPHSYFFSYSYPEKKKRQGSDQAEQHAEPVNLTRSIVTLVTGVVVIGALAEVMSKTVDLGLEGTGAPPVMTAILVAAISAAPEILTALRAALANRMQSVVNIALGASLSTVILTVPVMEAMALYSGQPFQMAMTPVQTVMIFITLLVSAINLNDGETNAIEGMTHFVLFATFIMLSCLGL
ncbi:CpaA protein [Pseudomonas amygdali pv. mori]|uniref:CpaA protein n=10 Tax=Pseudomonas syringae group TaxID=136849 RepID=A0AAX1VRR9_PSEAJ|nr:CpaA protein [Pseudomonas syringae pv. castaneae]KPX22766.1 CpaA protein [Pseudomonas amygdali pv. eriobotryae]KPX41719.1 CpaA protein [Pseudomonas savastanoi pv. glycinea]KPX55966.1 CpaA protein [Pseudomonas amygdali pv. hibisci]KPX70850.1 CpaA protein [Pseudomonas amygdali pv. photiniae]KPX90246.1 CpaA protein [Pseudomonas amygdali pv. myricae]RML78043.1 CpaA protein [Pseudomonas amygdali pv. tabaci]RMM32779.1 CpaA protein [Pseudomonas amygdali pv. lachrymans]RMO13434.1 CpaA protein [P